MAYCRKCGAEIYDESVVCPHCGVPQNNFQSYQAQSYQAQPVPQTSGGAGVLVGILFPIIGLIVAIVYASGGNHSAAKNTLVASIISFVVALIILMSLQ